MNFNLVFTKKQKIVNNIIIIFLTTLNLLTLIVKQKIVSVAKSDISKVQLPAHICI